MEQTDRWAVKQVLLKRSSSDRKIFIAILETFNERKIEPFSILLSSAV